VRVSPRCVRRLDRKPGVGNVRQREILRLARRFNTRVRPRANQANKISDPDPVRCTHSCSNTMNWEIETKMMAHEELACVAFWAAVRDQVSEASPGVSRPPSPLLGARSSSFFWRERSTRRRMMQARSRTRQQSCDELALFRIYAFPISRTKGNHSIALTRGFIRAYESQGIIRIMVAIRT